MYTISFKFFDDKCIGVEIEEDELDSFLECIGVNKVYFNKKKSIGFWIHAEHVRFMHINKMEE